MTRLRTARLSRPQVEALDPRIVPAIMHGFGPVASGAPTTEVAVPRAAHPNSAHPSKPAEAHLLAHGARAAVKPKGFGGPVQAPATTSSAQPSTVTGSFVALSRLDGTANSTPTLSEPFLLGSGKAVSYGGVLGQPFALDSLGLTPLVIASLTSGSASRVLGLGAGPYAVGLASPASASTAFSLTADPTAFSGETSSSAFALSILNPNLVDNGSFTPTAASFSQASGSLSLDVGTGTAASNIGFIPGQAPVFAGSALGATPLASGSNVAGVQATNAALAIPLTVVGTTVSGATIYVLPPGIASQLTSAPAPQILLSGTFASEAAGGLSLVLPLSTFRTTSASGNPILVLLTETSGLLVPTTSL